MPDYLICLGGMLWLIFLVWFWNRQGRSKQARVDEAWRPLAEEDGLRYSAGTGPSLMGAWDETNGPRVTGQYRGHPVELRLATHWIALDEGSTAVSYTVLTFQVNNRSGCSLFAGEKGALAKIFGKKNEV